MGHVKHQRHALVGMSLVFETKGNRGDVPRKGGRDASDTRNMPLVGVFLVFETKGRGGDVPNTNTCPTRACIGVRDEGKGRGHAYLGVFLMFGGYERAR